MLQHDLSELWDTDKHLVVCVKLWGDVSPSTEADCFRDSEA